MQAGLIEKGGEQGSKKTCVSKHRVLFVVLASYTVAGCCSEWTRKMPPPPKQKWKSEGAVQFRQSRYGPYPGQQAKRPNARRSTRRRKEIESTQKLCGAVIDRPAQAVLAGPARSSPRSCSLLRTTAHSWLMRAFCVASAAGSPACSAIALSVSTSLMRAMLFRTFVVRPGFRNFSFDDRAAAFSLASRLRSFSSTYHSLCKSSKLLPRSDAASHALPAEGGAQARFHVSLFFALRTSSRVFPRGSDIYKVLNPGGGGRGVQRPPRRGEEGERRDG